MGTLTTFAAGNLTADPEAKYTPNGKAVTEFTLAVNVGYGEYAYTEYLTCVAWDKTAEFVGKHFDKGSGAVCQLQQKTESWEDKETGAKRYRTKYRVVSIEFPPSSGKRSDNADSTPTEPARRATPARNAPRDIDADADLLLPF